MFDLGGVKYTITADTAAMLKAEAAIDKSIKNQVSSFAKADDAVRKYEDRQKSLGRTINSMGQVVSKSGKIAVSASIEYRKLSDEAQKSFDRVGSAAAKTAPRINGVTAAVINAGAGARGSKLDIQNMSYQLQDMAVQAQMGTSAFVIMAQQIPQMLVGMGAWAGAIGVAVTVLGLLATTMINTTSDATLLNQAVERTKAVMTVGAGGVVEYTQKMQELGRVSEIVAQYRIKAAMLDAQKAMKLTVKSMGTEMSKLNDGDIMTNFNDAIKYSDQLSSRFSGRIGEYAKFIGKQLGFADEEAQKMGSQFVQAFKSIEGAKTEKEVTSIQEKLIGLATQTGKADKKFTDMFSSVLDSFDELRSGAAVIDAVNDGVGNLSNKTNEAKGVVESMTQQLMQERVALEGGERAALEYSLQLQGVSEEQKKSILTLYDYNKGLIKQKEATEESIKKDKERKKSIDDVNDSLDAFFENESKQSNLDESRKTATLTTQVQSIGLTPEDQIQARYDREIALLTEAEEKKIQIEGTYAERRKQLEVERIESMRSLHTENNQFLEDAFGNLDTQIAGTFAQVAMGAKTGEDAMRSLASTMLTQLIGATVQYGVEMVKNKVLGQSLAASEQANILATTATGVAAQQTATASTVAAAATTATAAAPAAALTSTFSFGSAALIGGAALLGTLAISKMMASGAREYGGPVTNGKSYLVGERGPELFTPHVSGGITSNKDMMGSGGGMTVNVNNNTPYEVFVTKDEAANIANIQIGREAGNLAKGRGKMAGAMKQGAGTRFNATN